MGFLSLQTGDQEERSFPFQMRGLRPRQHLRLAFPSLQGEGGGGIQAHSHQMVPVSHQSHSVYSCSAWLALRLRNDFELLLVPAPSHPTECPWDSRERGKLSVLLCFRVPSLQSPHSGLSAPSCTQGTREGEKALAWPPKATVGTEGRGAAKWERPE